MVECHLNLKNDDEAVRLVEELRGICDRYAEQEQLRQILYCGYLTSLTYLRFSIGLPGAMEAGQEALTVARMVFGDDASETMWVAVYLADIGAANSHDANNQLSFGPSTAYSESHIEYDD